MGKYTVVEREVCVVFMCYQWLITIQGRSSINKAKSVLDLESIRGIEITNDFEFYAPEGSKRRKKKKRKRNEHVVYF